MSDDPHAAPNFLKASLGLFLFALPISCVARFGGKWFFMESNAAYFSWLRTDWLSELIVSLIMATLLALGITYQNRRNYWENYGKRDDRYES